MSRINLLDDPKLLVKKIKSAKTDSGEGLQWDDPNRPEARNLITMYTLATGMSLVRYLPTFSIAGRICCKLFVPDLLSQQNASWSILTGLNPLVTLARLALIPAGVRLRTRLSFALTVYKSIQHSKLS